MTNKMSKLKCKSIHFLLQMNQQISDSLLDCMPFAYFLFRY